MAHSPISTTNPSQLFRPNELETTSGIMEPVQKVAELFKYVNKDFLYYTSNTTLTEEAREFYKRVYVGFVNSVDGRIVLHKLRVKGSTAAVAFLLSDDMLKNFYIRLPTPEEQQKISALRRE